MMTSRECYAVTAVSYCELDGDDTITLQEEELSLGKWVKAEELSLEDDGISLTREMILKFREDC